MTDVATLKRMRQDEFIEKRTRIEQEVNKFLASLDSWDDDMKAACNYKPELTARTVLSALWAEPFDEEKYNMQLASLNAYIVGVQKICDKMNEEALKCLQS